MIDLKVLNFFSFSAYSNGEYPSKVFNFKRKAQFSKINLTQSLNKGQNNQAMPRQGFKPQMAQGLHPHAH